MSNLDFLKPKKKPNIIDLLKSIGFDTSDWSNFRGGEIRAATNPKYCYEWSFEDDVNKIIVINLWFSNLRSESDKIYQTINMKEYSEIAIYPNQKKRAINLDSLLEKAYNKKYAIKVIICDKSSDQLDTDEVHRRFMDKQSWYIESYDQSTGECTVVRNNPPLYIDQFTINEDLQENPSSKLTRESSFYKRDIKVRQEVLNRAKGSCELCGERGFITSNGSIYLESHHIIPLSENGLDNISNVIALCPNHHREAHYGQDVIGFRAKLNEKIKIFKS